MKSNERLYLDLHVLQTVPPSCVNRDDTGSPKTAVYGGVTRARVSSQSWKRSMRLMFRDLIPAEQLGTRTKKIVAMVASEITRLDPVLDASLAAQRILETAGLKIKSVEKGTDALFFISTAQVKGLAKLAVEDPETIKDKPSKEAKVKAQSALRDSPGIDIALFGRMVADDPSLNTDACAQVAHAISTHKTSTEYDYFTAVDDMPDEGHAGAGHLGVVEFNSATLYRYATIALHQLHDVLAEDAVDATINFVRAFATSMPTGKQNTFANRTLPDAMLLAVRSDQPINLVGAFEKAVPASGDGYAVASARRLAGHAAQVYSSFAPAPALSLIVGEPLAEIGPVLSLPETLEALRQELGALLEHATQPQ